MERGLVSVSEILLVCNTGRTFISSVTSPTFTDTMSLRLVLRLLSRNRGGFLEDARNGVSFSTDSPPRHLHHSQLIFLLNGSFAVVRAVASWDPLPLYRHNRNQLEFIKIVRHTEWHHVEPDNHQRSLYA